jgi:2-phospho-L-lactate/phosphoenolpyruvate guanylyltransferase
VIFAILPVKDPKNAKQRLNGFLSAEDREALARLLFKETLAKLSASTGIDRVVVVSNDREIVDHASRSGATVFEEQEQVSHGVSADSACRRAKALGASTALLVPIDVPLVRAADFSRLAAAARPGTDRGLIIVPSSDGSGTNALVRTPPDVIESRFGPGSFRIHLEQARSKSVPVEVLRLGGLMFDIDTPDDIVELLRRAPGTSVSEFLRTTCALR